MHETYTSVGKLLNDGIGAEWHDGTKEQGTNSVSRLDEGT